MIRRRPWLRPRRRPEPFEALAWAVCEQLIDSRRASGIERSIVYRWGPNCLRHLPAAAHGRRAGRGRSGRAGRLRARAQALDRAPQAAREVASGRPTCAEHESSWRRLLAIPNIGNWTIEMLAFEGQGRDDKIPALDLAYVKLVGRLAHGGRRATEEEVRAFFAPYEEYAALAGIYALGRRYL